MKYTERQRVAYHEAAHAVVSIWLTDEFDHVRIDESWAHGIRTDGAIVPNADPVDRWTALTQAKVAIAGPIAEKIMTRQKTYKEIFNTTGRIDFQNVVDFSALHLFAKFPYRELDVESKKRVLQFARWKLLPQVRQTVTEQWARIVVVGDALTERKKLTHREVLDVRGIDSILMFFLRERMAKQHKKAHEGGS